MTAAKERLLGGQYRIIRQIASGGMSTVYLAVDTVLERRCVIKTVESGDEEASVRLKDEAKFLRPLDHPGINRALGYFQEDGQPYLVLNWIEGRTLQDILDERHALAWEEVARIGQSLLDTLAYAHAHGVIHRDIKPANVLIPGGDCGHGTAVLLDFGAFGTLEKSGHTQVGMLAGTPLFMAPEQITGQSQTVATDIYGVGALMFTMIYGHPPYFSEHSTSFTLLTDIVKGELSFPKAPVLPVALRVFIRQCLARDPGDRPGSAFLALSELQGAIGGTQRSLPFKVTGCFPSQPASEASAPGGKERSEPLSKSAYGAWIGWILAALLVAGLVGGVVLRTPGKPPPPPVEHGSEIIAPALPLLGVPSQWQALLAIVLGIGLLAVAGMLGSWVRDSLHRREGRIEKDAGSLLIGTRSRADLGKTLANSVEQLLEQCQRIDEKVLGLTICSMIGEYHKARSSDDRQSALMNAVQLLEKLKELQAPWYVRQQKLIAYLTSSVAVLAGLVSVATGIVKLGKIF